ncbi:rod shape-determining protein MreC [Pilibacter termitis]|uniref:Cell shape-determining protein MreC n=1 Tax=Pilibacter termitis TaxID=263852 RepID=A0A1T4LK12_9ENTE|nr:rod shape-determining protein MreC [Pilibacter termitis]SJZ55080.1 rod shape-determining protein MreC [Pilibacter termitis]
MKKFNPNKNIIVGLIIAIAVVALVTLTTQRRAEGVEITAGERVVNDSMSIVDKIIAAPGRFIHNIITSIEDLQGAYQENEQLKKKLDNYDEAILQTKNLKDEIEKLKKELKLNETLSSFSKITANVITRSPDTWQDMLVIDKGKADGLKVNMAVMSQEGLVGRIIQVSDHSSKVELLTSSNQLSNHFPVKIAGSNSNDGFGLLKSYDEKTQSFIITQVTGNTDLKKGDIVQTSGLGGNSPSNLLVGTVEKVETNKTGLDREVYVKPAAQMYDISVVTVIQRAAEVGENE